MVEDSWKVNNMAKGWKSKVFLLIEIKLRLCEHRIEINYES